MNHTNIISTKGKLLGVILALMGWKHGWGQNLVANGSFEDVNICTEFKARCSPAGWFFVSQKEAKGYYSMNHIPGTIGNKYISIDVARSNMVSRQYWETMLLCDLK